MKGLSVRWRAFRLAGFIVAKDDFGWFWGWPAGPFEWSKVRSSEGRQFASRREAMAGCVKDGRAYLEAGGRD